MNSDTEAQERNCQDEIDESSASHDNDSQLTKIVGIEHAMVSAEIDDLVRNPENGGAELDNDSCNSASNSTHNHKDDIRVKDELSPECKELSQMENDEAVAIGEVQEHEGSGDPSCDKTVVVQEVKADEECVEVSDMKEAVNGNCKSMDGIQRTTPLVETVIGNKRKVSQEDGDEVAKEKEAEKRDEKDKPNLEKTAGREWIDILGNGLLKKKIIIPGKGPETRPKPGDEVTMIVNGVLMDGTKLKEEVLVFIHDDRELIQAFELAVALMEDGEKSIVYTDAKYAYGPFGCESPKIPKNCNITYTLEIVSIVEGPDKGNMSDEERIRIGDKKRLIGNSLYSKGNYGSAIDCYKRALAYLDGSANKDVIDMKVKCQNNLSAAQLKVNAFQAALQSCNSVLTLQSNNIKAMFRKAKCLEALGKQNEALKCLKETSMIDPSNKMVYSELIRLDRYVKKSLQKESDMYKRMVGGLKKEDEAKGQEEDTNFFFKFMIGTLVVGILVGIILNRN